MDSRIHPTSGVALLPQLSLWDTPPTQESVEDGNDYELRPISTFSSDTPIRFEIKNPSNEYVNLSEVWLAIKLKFTLSQGTTAITKDSWSTVKLAPNLMHSLFKHVGIETGGKPVSPSPSLYAFKSYFLSKLGFSKGAKDGFLDSIGWSITNLETLTTTSELTIDLVGVLNMDLNFQEKWILGGTDMVVELIPNPVSFYASCSDSQKVVCDFVDCSLFVRRNRVTKELESAHEKALTRAPTRYPFVRTDIRAMTLAPGTNDYILDNVATGFLPRRIFLAFVKASDMYSKPFNFQPFGLNYLVSYQDGVQIPTKAFTPSFKNKLFTREFVSFYRALGQNYMDPLIAENKKTWGAAPIYGINFRPTRVSESLLGHMLARKRLDICVSTLDSMRL